MLLNELELEVKLCSTTTFIYLFYSLYVNEAWDFVHVDKMHPSLRC